MRCVVALLSCTVVLMCGLAFVSQTFAAPTTAPTRPGDAHAPAPATTTTPAIPPEIARAAETYRAELVGATNDYRERTAEIMTKYRKQLDAARDAALRAGDLERANAFDERSKLVRRQLEAIPPASEMLDYGGAPAPQRVMLADLAALEASGIAFGKKGLTGLAGGGAGGRIVVGGVHSPNGIAMHPAVDAPAIMRFDLDGQFTTLDAKVGLNDTVSASRGPVRFTVIGDARQLWQSPPIQDAGTPRSLSISVRGVKTLELRVEVAGDHTDAHAVWIEPQLSR